ncbi:MAG: 3D domain-containing protein [Lentisphaerae bacterium]|nr:3D domain-containing protein [Lentisphaerota bacterium]
MLRHLLGLLVIVGLVSISGCATIRPPDGVPVVEQRMAVTGYCKCGDCCGWRRNWFGRPVFTSGPNKGKYKQVGMTASGSMAKHGTIAADLKLYPLGTIMYIDGYGYGRVEDTGGRVKGQHIDLYFYTHNDALRWGRQARSVKVWVARR